MKRMMIFVVLLVAVMVLFLACPLIDPLPGENPMDENLLVGTWSSGDDEYFTFYKDLSFQMDFIGLYGSGLWEHGIGTYKYTNTILTFFYNDSESEPIVAVYTVNDEMLTLTAIGYGAIPMLLIRVE